MRVHVDYLTLVSEEPISEFSGNDLMLYRWALSIAYGGERGYELRPSALLGYKGHQVGALFYGERPDGCMLRVSGEAAHLVAREVSGWGFRATRCDIAVDIMVGTDDAISEKVLLAMEETKREGSERRGRPWKIHPHGNGVRTTNLDVGARTSPLYLRVYDKEEEGGKNFKGVLRYEAELKDRHARYAWDRIALDPDDAEVLLSLGRSAFSERGIKIPCDGGIIEYRYQPKSVPVPDTEAALRWLERQVSPTVRRLLKSEERDRILMALSLLVRPDVG